VADRRGRAGSASAGGLTGGTGGQRERGQADRRDRRAARARGRADRRGPNGREAWCGGSGPGPLDLRRTARIGLGLIKTGPPDLGRTVGIRWPA
jgi:hypothetical protein